MSEQAEGVIFFTYVIEFFPRDIPVTKDRAGLLTLTKRQIQTLP